jgi:hypothetical protein
MRLLKVWPGGKLETILVLKKAPLKIGGRWTVVDIVCPLLFVINDGKQGDQLCGLVNGHQKSQRRHHQSCNCKFDDLDNPDI